MNDSPLNLGGGWFARPRGLTAWPLYQSLGALGRRLVEVLLERARWRPGEVWILGHRVQLEVGQLIDSEEELARLCGRGTTRKVVRTALARLAEGGFLDRRPALPAGQCPFVITIRDYALLQSGAEREGQHRGPPKGEARARQGPGEGQAGASVEQREPGEPGEPDILAATSAAPSSSPAPREPVLELLPPPGEAPPKVPGAHQQVVQAWFEGWERIGRGKHPTLTGAEAATVKRLVAQLGADETVTRMSRALEDAWFVQHGDLLTFGRQVNKFAPPGRGAVQGARAMGAVGTNWEEQPW